MGNLRSRAHILPTSGSLLAILFVAGLSYLVMAFFAPGGQSVARAQSEGEELFNSTCAGCHQAGGVGIVGTFPPLAGNPAAADADYVASVIREGKSGPLEVLGESYDGEMPPVTSLSDDEVTAVVAYVVGIAGGGEAPPTGPETTGTPADPQDPDVSAGHDIFVGSNSLDAGGPACAACHTAGEVGSLGGSTLGPDLTDAVETYGGEAGLAAWLTTPASQTMIPIFGDKPLTETEISHLVAFLADAPDQDSPDGYVDWLWTAAIVGIIALFGGMAIVGRGMRQTYRDKLRSSR